MKQINQSRSHAFLSAIILCCALTFTAPTASARVKGRWTVTIHPQASPELSTTLSFQRGGTGVGGNELSGGSLAYQETDTDLKVSWEFAGPVFPALVIKGPSTILLRGTKHGKDLIIGTLIIISNELDPDSPIGYATKTGSFIAQREGPGPTAAFQ